MDHKSTNRKTRAIQILQNQNTPQHISIPNNFGDHHYIYTYGSKTGMKVDFADIFHNQEFLKRLSNESSIYSEKVNAINLAMAILAYYKSSKFIYSDSKSILFVLQNKDILNNLTTKLLSKMNTYYLPEKKKLFLSRYRGILVYMELKEQTKL